MYDPKTNTVKVFTSSGTFKFNNKTSKIDEVLDEKDVMLVDELSEVSKTQLEEWLSLSSWFGSFKKISSSEAVNKTLLFYDISSKSIKICDTNKGISSVKINKIDELPDANFGYIESCHLMTRKQFLEWLEGNWSPPVNKKNHELKQDFVAEIQQKKKRKYIHTVHDGTVLIEDIQIEGNPLKLSGKYHFVPVDSVGEDKIESSIFLAILLKKGKVEYVDEEYVADNKHKFKKSMSLNTTLPVGNVDDFTEKDNDIITINVE